MMRTTNIISIASFFFILLSACACNKKIKDNKFATYLPVQIGNTWVYQVTDTMEHNINKVTQTVTITVLKDTLIDDLSQSFVVQENRNGDKRNIIWQLKEGQLLRSGKYWNDNRILFKENPTVGDTWIIDREYGNGTSFDDTSYVAEQYTSYPFAKRNAPAYKIIRDWTPYGKSSPRYQNYEIYMPYVGLVKALYEFDIYGKHSETWTLTEYYTK